MAKNKYHGIREGLRQLAAAFDGKHRFAYVWDGTVFSVMVYNLAIEGPFVMVLDEDADYELDYKEVNSLFIQNAKEWFASKVDHGKPPQAS